MKTTTYSPQSPLRHPLQMCKELFSQLWGSRELVGTLFKRDLKTMYRQSVLGYFWVITPPLVTAATWWFFHKQGIISDQNTSIPYPVYVLIGSVLWGAFSDAIINPLQAYQFGESVFTKLNVVPEAFIASGIARNVFNLIVRLIVTLPICYFLLKQAPPAELLFFPLALFAITLLGTALGFCLIPLGSLYHDVSKGITMLLPFLMYSAPVVWAAQQNNEGSLLHWLSQYNPLSHLIEYGRNCLTIGGAEHLVPTLLTIPFSLLLLLFGMILLKISHPHLVVRMGM